MFLLARYVIREHIGPFFFAFTLITSMLVLNFVLQAMRYIIGKGIGFQVIVEFIAYNLAGIIVLVVPMAILVATIMAFGRLASDNEITAMKAGGINFAKLIFPVCLVSGLVTYGIFVFNDKILPIANHNARVLKKNIQAKRPTLSIEPGVFLEGIENFSMIVDNKDELGSGIYGITIYDKSDRKSSRTITAEKGSLEIDAVHEDMVLKLENGEMHELNPSKMDGYQRMRFDKYKVIVPVENLTLKSGDETFRNDREKNIDQLMDEVARHKKERDRQLGLAAASLEKKPQAVSYLDARAKGNLARMMLEQSWSDRVDDRFTTWNLKESLDTAYHEDSFIWLNKNSADIVRNVLDSSRSLTPASIVQRDPLTLDPLQGNRMSSFKNIDDSVRIPLTTMANQLSSQLNTASSYQRLMDQCMVEVNKKYAIPMACIIFVLLGAPLGVKARRGGLGLAAGISLFFFIAYYFCLILGEDFADRQLINPFFAMWSMNIFLGILGIILIYQTTSEKNLGIHNVGNQFRKLFYRILRNESDEH